MNKRIIVLKKLSRWRGRIVFAAVCYAWGKVTRIGTQPISVQAGRRYYFEAPEGGPDWGIRFTVTPLLPKG